jgi:curved DNA-binding protein CbpA
VAPYYTMAEIKKAYKELIKKNHPDKIKGDKKEARKNFERIQKAYEKIKKERKKDSGGGVYGASKECLENVLTFFTIINIGYYILKILPKILQRIFELIDFFYYVLRGTGFVLAIIYSFFPHYFEEDYMKVLASFGLTIIISLLFKDMFYQNKKKSDKKKKKKEADQGKDEGKEVNVSDIFDNKEEDDKNKEEVAQKINEEQEKVQQEQIPLAEEEEPKSEKKD